MQPRMPIAAAASTCLTASRVEAAEIVANACPAAPDLPSLAAAIARQPSTRSSNESVWPSPSEPGHTVPVQPASSMRCARFASLVVHSAPSSRNGVTRAGITPRNGAPVESALAIDAR